MIKIIETDVAIDFLRGKNQETNKKINELSEFDFLELWD